MSNHHFGRMVAWNVFLSHPRYANPRDIGWVRPMSFDGNLWMWYFWKNAAFVKPRWRAWARGIGRVFLAKVCIKTAPLTETFWAKRCVGFFLLSLQEWFNVTHFGGNYTMNMSGRFEGFPVTGALFGLVWVSNIMTLYKFDTFSAGARVWFFLPCLIEWIPRFFLPLYGLV